MLTIILIHVQLEGCRHVFVASHAKGNMKLAHNHRQKAV